MLGQGSARIYNLLSVIFLTLTVLWVLFVVIQLL